MAVLAKHIEIRVDYYWLTKEFGENKFTNFEIKGGKGQKDKGRERESERTINLGNSTVRLKWQNSTLG